MALPRMIVGPVILSGLWIVASPTIGRSEEPTLSTGRWKVDATGLGWPTRLDSLEIRPASRPGEAELVAFERVGDEIRVWGKSRVDRRGPGPSPTRWFSATWPSGGATALIQVRPESSGRLIAVVRERSKDRGIGDRVRQVRLSPLRSDERPVSDGLEPAPPIPVARFRFEADLRETSKLRPYGLFVAGSDGSSPRAVVLPEGFAQAAHPAWSLDGRWIAFATLDASGHDSLIQIAPASGGSSTAIASGSMPTWSRDGRKIAYVASGRPDYATDWSSPGRNDERIESITLSGPGAGEVEVLARGLWPRWSPTDDSLAYVDRREANWDIFLRSADGLGLTRLTDDPALDTQPTWAADGGSVVFLSDRGNRWDLYRVQTRSRGAVRRLTDHVRREDYPSLSPDGRFVAFVDGRGRPEGAILILDLDRGTVRPFPENPDGDRDPAWSPDGKSIAFVSRRPAAMTAPDGENP
ncbi:TolB family protein [Tundrisphaera lichenicola]|uniref:TolB family protein n=1 Tax=Tundrisphaera lichenicola TaxID=2029860 RepID=UPI003EB71B5B